MNRYFGSMRATAYSTWFVVLIAIILMVPGMSAAHAQENGQVAVRLVAPAQVGAGAVIPLTLQVDANAAQVGGMEAVALFDPAAAEFANFYPSATAQAGLGTLLAPETAVGAVVGFFTCPTSECQEVGAALAAFASAGVASAAGDVLATIDVQPLVEGQVEIRLENLVVVDPAGHPLPIGLEQNVVVVQVGDGGDSYAAPGRPWEAVVAQVAADIDVAAAADVTGDTFVSHADVMETALEWQIAHEELAPCANPVIGVDLNQDGCVTVVDVQLAAAHVNTGIPDPSENPPLLDPSAYPNQLHLPSVSSDGEAFGLFIESDETVDAAAELTFVVNSLTDEGDVNIGDGICRTSKGECTLRAAISEANNHNGPDRIHFNIPGSGVRTIRLNSRLPSLWDNSGGTTIDGYTQPGASPNTHARISNANILIEVRGREERFDSLAITARNNIVRGIAFYDFRRAIWVYGSGAKQNYIVGNFLGTDAASQFFLSGQLTGPRHGINVEQGAQWNRVGGIKPEDRNVISGNRRSGIGLWHWPTNSNLIFNNLVGLSADGTRRLPNRRHGIDLNYGASNNTIGGRSTGQRNVVSGNGGSGIEVSHGESTSNNSVIGNFVGTDVSGNAISGQTFNGGFGIQLKDRVRNNFVSRNILANNSLGGIGLDNLGNCCLQDNVIEYNRIGIGLNDANLGNGGSGVYVIATRSRIGPGNIIAYNHNGGIVIEGNANDRNTITQNSIFANTGLGIDLAPLGSVNANDAGDGDSGPNQQLNFPVITQARPDRVIGNACAKCRIEIFLATGQAGEYGQGKTLVGAGNTNDSGAFNIPISGVRAGDHLTTTATDSAGNTSEFSANARAQW